MAITIAVETPLQDDVRAMVAELNAIMIPLTPREFQFQLTVEQMAEPSLTVVRGARRRRAAHVGMGALKDHGGGLGEVKRMFTLPEVRGQRVGSQLLQRIEALARDEGHFAAGAGNRRGAGLRAGLAASTSAAVSPSAALCSTIPIPDIRASTKRSSAPMSDLTSLTIAEARDEAARPRRSPPPN